MLSASGSSTYRALSIFKEMPVHGRKTYPPRNILKDMDARGRTYMPWNILKVLLARVWRTYLPYTLPPSAFSSVAISASARYPLPPRFTTLHLILEEDERLRLWRRRAVLRLANWSTLITTSRTIVFGRGRAGTRNSATVPLLVLPVVICLSQRLCHASQCKPH